MNYKLGKMKDRKNTWVIPHERARLEFMVEQRKYHTHEETADCQQTVEILKNRKRAVV